MSLLEPATLRAASAMLSDAHRRIDVLARLEPNWDSYGGVPPTAVAVSSANGLLIALAATIAETPVSLLAPWSVAPIHNGGLQLEWKGSRGLVEIEISPKGAMSFLAEKTNGTTTESDGAIGQTQAVQLIRDVVVP